MRMEGEIEKDEFMQKKSNLDSQMEATAKEIDDLSSETNDNGDGFKTIEEWLAGLKKSLDKYMDHKNMDTKIIPETVVEAFTRRIIVSADGFDWYLRSENEKDEQETDPEGRMIEKFDSKDYSIMHSIHLTIEDAKKYVYSFSTRRRVHGWRDITIRLWI